MRYAGPVFRPARRAPPPPPRGYRYAMDRSGRLRLVRAAPPKRVEMHRLPPPRNRPPPVVQQGTVRQEVQHAIEQLPPVAQIAAAPIFQAAESHPAVQALFAVAQLLGGGGPSLTNGAACAPGNPRYPGCACPGGRVDPDGMCSDTRAWPGAVGGGQNFDHESLRRMVN